MRSTERIRDRIDLSLRALDLRYSDSKVHTRDGDIGLLKEVQVLRGKVIVDFANGQKKLFSTRDVAPLSSPLPGLHFKP